MPRTVFVCLALVFCLLVRAETPATASPRPIPAIQHVVVISLDGARPDVVLLADAPNLHALIRGGAYSFWAKTTAVSITLPSHVSMLTGVTPNRHGITWNKVLPFREPVYPSVPTIFEAASKAGYVTAMIAGKTKFATLNKPGTITHVFVPEADNSTDDVIVARAVQVIEAHRPQLTFIHFPSLDRIGHDKGWGSPEQFAQLAQSDRDIGLVLAALDRSGMRSDTLVIVSADHGGAGLTHGADDPRSRHIPWIANGPGVRKGYDLTRRAGLDVRTEDTFATVAYVLGLTLPPDLDGRPVREAFDAKP